MGIKGLSDRRRLPRIGKIHLGVKAQSSKGTEYPKATDYFVVRPDDTTPEDAVAAFRAVYGEKPRELDIRFPTDDPADWADPWYRAYSQSWGLTCLSDDTEVLTDEGWRGIGGVRVGQRVIAMDLASGVYKEEPVEDILRFPYEGDLLAFRTKSLDALLTPDHRVVHRGNSRVPWMVSPAIKLANGSRWPTVGVIDKPDLVGIDDELLQILGWVIGDGTVQRPSRWTNSHPGSRGANKRLLTDEERAQRAHYLSISQSKPQYVAEIGALLKRRFGRVHCSVVKNSGGPSDRTKDVLPRAAFFLGRLETDTCLDWLGESVHRIPRRLLSDASPRQLNVLYGALMKADGSRDASHGERFYPGHDNSLADDFQELCTRLGRRSSINEQAGDNEGQYVVHVSPPRVRSHTLKAGWESVPFEGEVWCLMVPSGTFVARRNGRVFTTGNCKGDGETARAKWDAAATGLRPDGTALKGGWAASSTKAWSWQEIPCAGPDCPMQKTKPASCKMVMNLQFLLWRVRGIGAWQIDTGSWNSIRNLQDGIELIKAATGGRVRGLPLKLRLSPKEVTPPEGDVKTKTVWVLDISLRDLTLSELLAEATKLGPGLLPPPVDDEKPPEDLFPEAVDEETGEIEPVEPVLPAAPPVTVTVTTPLKQEAMPNSLALHMRGAPSGHDSATCGVCAEYKEKAAQEGKRLEGME